MLKHHIVSTLDTGVTLGKSDLSSNSNSWDIMYGDDGLVQTLFFDK
jgi:hypothetical protein